MIKSITQVGDDLVIEIDKAMLVIDKSILNLLEAGPNKRFCIKVEGKEILLVPIEEGAEIAVIDVESLHKRIEKNVENHKVMFKKLAE